VPKCDWCSGNCRWHFFLKTFFGTMQALATPSREAMLSLYHNMLRTSQSFSSYNFRQYFIRRTKDTFRSMQVCRQTTYKTLFPDSDDCYGRTKMTQRDFVRFIRWPWRTTLFSREVLSSISYMAVGKLHWKLRRRKSILMRYKRGRTREIYNLDIKTLPVFYVHGILFIYDFFKLWVETISMRYG